MNMNHFEKWELNSDINTFKSRKAVAEKVI